ncbi:outer membrane beta-barrel protein [Mucilaginibacter sp. McL0603]|uniref:outer membrane beta-barrel protein n=1 Tax=Mucilaginibacter sp. McL0603 TaxID=3415670 RepID=UPI003CF3EF1F
MSKEKDEDLDKLFKKGLEDPVSEPAFRDADWDAMEQMLDKGKKRPAIIFWLPIIGSAAALILIFLGYLFLKPEVVKPGKKEQMAITAHPDTNSASQAKNNTGTSGEPARKGADSSKQQTQTAQYAVKPSPQSHGQKSNSFFTLSSGKDRRTATGKDINKAADGSKANNVQPDTIGDQRVIANNVVAGKTQPGTADSRTALGTADDQKQKDIQDNILASKTQLGTADSKTQLGTADSKTSLGTADNQKQKDNAANALASATVTTPSSVKVGNQQKMGSHPQYAVSIWASSDLNGVNSAFQQSKVGGNFGAAFSVTFAQKWTLSTGATYDIKPYLTNFDNYNTNYQFKNPPTTVNADCRMLEIPLLVNYRVYSQNANRISVGTGLSSYFMLREDYQFNYADPYNATGPTHYTVINKNQNILSVLNLNATYAHQINSKMGVILQPYLKIPLTDVGASQVRLRSSGIALGLSWNLNAFSKPK